MEEKIRIKLFGEPEVTVGGETVALGIEWPTLALFILWRHRGDVDIDTLVDVLKPRSKAETDRASFIKKHKDTLRKRLPLTLPMTLKLTTLGPAILEQAWVDVVEFDAKITSGDSREVEEAVALRQRGPLLVTLTEPDVFIKERAAREEKYQDALWILIQEDRDTRPQEAVQSMELLLESGGLPESRSAFLQEERLRLQHEIFKSKPVREADKNTRSLPLLSLPNFPTELIGRETETASVQELLHMPGLVTLIGPAGIGKTRLAAAVAVNFREHFPGGTGWIDLAATSDDDQIVGQISAALGLMEQKERSQREALLTYLETKNLLLVWDNCEHVAAECARLAAEVLRRCPEIRLLTTSRETLHVYGERLFPVPVLPDSSAVPLFVTRAQAVNPNLQLTEQSQALLLKICRELDGLPLALELAAGLVLIRTLRWIADNLHRRFELLTGGSRIESSRHASLGVAFDLSYDLLPLNEQALFRTLGVFAGSFSLEAAESVACSLGTAHLLTQLVRKSLARGEENDQEIRFYLLASLRQYAQDKLRAHEEYEETSRRHRDYYLALAEEAAPNLRGADQKSWLDRLEMEHDNFRGALSWRADEQSVRLACALQRFWWVRGYPAEGLRWFEREIDDKAVVSNRVRATALIGAGRLAYVQGRFGEAQNNFQDSLALQTQLGDARGIAIARINLADVAAMLGQYAEAEIYYQKSLADFRELGDKEGIADALMKLGVIEQNQGHYATARERHAESLKLRQDLGDPQGIADSLMSMNDLALRQGDLSEARTMIEECFSIFQRLNSRKRMAECLIGFGRVAMAEGKPLEAQTLLGQSLTVSQEIGHQWITAQALNYLANIAYDQQDYKQFEDLLRRSLALMQSLGVERAVAAMQANLGSALTKQGKFTEARQLFCLSLNEFRRSEDRQNIASVTEDYAVLESATGKNTEAATLFGVSEALAALIGFCRPANEDGHYNQTVRCVREALGEEAFAEAWAMGRAMTWERAVAYALGEAAL